MKLVFLRHGKAEERGSVQPDSARRLTPNGIEEMRREALGMRALQFKFDRILASPLPRALMTAQIAAEGLDDEPREVKVCEELAADSFGLDELRALLGGISDDATVLLVGHEPDFSSIVQQLTGAQIELKKGSAVCVETDMIRQNAGILRWLLTPRQLIAAGCSERAHVE